MRKILSLLVVLVLMIFLGACSSPTANEGATKNNSYEKENGEEKDPPGGEKCVVSGEEVLNAAGVRIVYLGMIEEDLYPGLLFEVVNNGTHRVNIQTSDVLVNDSIEGFPSYLNLDPGEKKPDGHRQIIPEDVAISAIEKISMRFIIYKAEPWEEIYQSEVISMKPF
ncbi:MAG: hypothetical protein GX883_00490 [Firmicutes bacterium]|nr:hypothetical protein [Bacillota bacterium]